MAKINFTKAEKEIERNLHRMFVQKLIELTEKEQKKELEQSEKANNNKNTLSILNSIQKDLERLSSKSEQMWIDLGMSKEDITKFIENPGQLSHDEWDTIKDLMNKIKVYKNTEGKSLENEINDEIVQSERVKHEDRRINVNQKWKPV